MRVKNKKTIMLLVVAGCVLLGCWLWLSLRTVEIVAVHEDGNHASVLVKAFPVTDKGKVNWWLKNKDMLRDKYDIPKPSSSGNFTIIFWDFGDGYKEEGKYDRRCFDNMKTKENCIEKNAVFAVRQYHDDDVIFATYEGRYSLNKSGDIIKIKRE
ncbi:DUF943 family protein [Kosakonia oryziphila]|jgi:Enterobacterial putative membrane protein (DUF943).|uniref:Putative membrane protein n=1 Tax=Kosakonia oryziphila TaxID=1005667 RepID=A0A1C3ZPY5_9ENTR|nr:DUF943 family protein [Kosakonia oryziphila]SCB84438.1 putative membrane protein [Kosakonia oryziphila]